MKTGLSLFLGLILSAVAPLRPVPSIAEQGPAPSSPAPATAEADPRDRRAQDVASLNLWQRGVYEQGLQMAMTHEQAMKWARGQYVGGWNVDGP